MTRPRVRVYGLGPGSAADLTLGTRHALECATVARLRTARHPVVEELGLTLASYDAWYEDAASFEELYARIVDDLIVMALSEGVVDYFVPGSPVVAEHTVELLLERAEVEVVVYPAVSVIDVACRALRLDPMARELRIVDALASSEPFRGPGPLLVLQTYAPEIMAVVADRLPPQTSVIVLHHLGLVNERVEQCDASALSQFPADHLTSVYVEGLRTAGDTVDDLVSFMRRLRSECPWDREQTHGTLTRHLVEESYEALDALEVLARQQEEGDVGDESARHAEEELGDLLFQIIFHAELGDEEELFNFATIADGVRDKLTFRHPHVFGDAVVSGAAEVETRWEDLKKKEKGRTSVTDGIATHLPALALYAKLRKKADVVGLSRTQLDARRDALARLRDSGDGSLSEHDWGMILADLVDAAQGSGVDVESALRQRALRLRDEIITIEQRPPKG